MAPEVVAQQGDGHDQRQPALAVGVDQLQQLGTVGRVQGILQVAHQVLQHLMGYLKNALDAADRAELLELIDAYREGRLPLIVPITLLRHHFRRHPHPYIERQIYLAPHPAELMLRNLI